MKILSVTFCNINSLKADPKTPYTIRFDEAPFAQSGLFAITGPTGAGKTTILDAITVALYGRVARHGNTNPEDIMTRHTGESLSEVEFAVGGKAYRARWNMKRAYGKPDGNMQAPVMSLYEDIFSEKPAAVEDTHNKTKVLSKIVELTGLDYNRFMRSVMLSQGEFAAFLKARENERAELLERITGTEIYSQISKAAHERAKAEKAALDDLQRQLDQFQLLGEEERSAKRRQGEDYRKQAEAEAKLLAELRRLLSSFDNIRKQQAKISQTNGLLVQLQGRRAAHQPDLERLERHRKVQPFTERLVQLRERNIQIRRLEDQSKEAQENIRRLTQEQNTAYQAKTLASGQLQQAELQLQAVEPKIEKALQLLGEMAIKRGDLAKEQSKLQKLRQETAVLQNKKDTAKNTLENAQGRLKQIGEWLDTHAHYAQLAADIPLISQRLAQLMQNHDKCVDKRRQLNVNGAGSQSLAASILDMEQKKEALEKSAAETGGQLRHVAGQAAQLPDVEKAEQQRNLLATRMDILRQLSELAQAYAAKDRQRAKLRTEYKQTEAQLKEAQSLAKNLGDKVDAAQQAVNDAELLREKDLLIAKYEQDRQKLAEGEPCPLCGSTEHPFSDGNFAGHARQGEQMLKERRTKLDGLQRQLANAQNRGTALQTQLDNITNNGILLGNEMDGFASKFEQIGKGLEGGHQIGEAGSLAEALERLRQQWLEEGETLSNIRTIGKERQRLETLAAKQKENLMAAESELQLAQSKLENLKEGREKLEAELAGLLADHEEIEGEIVEMLQKYALALPDEEHLRRKLPATLRAKAQEHKERENEKNDIQNNITALKSSLNGLRDQLLGKQRDEAGLLAELGGRQTAIDALQAELGGLTQGFGTPDPKGERERLNALAKARRDELEGKSKLYEQKRNALKHNGELFDKLRYDIETQHNLLEHVAEGLAKDLQAAGFAGHLEAEEAVLPPKEAQRIDALLREMERREVELATALRDAENALQAEREAFSGDEGEEELRESLLEKERESEELQRQIGSIDAQLESDAKLRAEHGELAATWEKRSQEWKRWSNLKELIGSADGKKFSEFAQGLTLARLVYFANLHLAKLNERYLIQKRQEEDLGLEIVDTFQAEAVRPMQSLSGGESFLVSLALALGLSDLAGGRMRIESLFIDEGFGTLDSETLDSAITTLENLQADGKTIGIISHVEALKERIGTQIKVSKLSGGYSSLRVAAGWE